MSRYPIRQNSILDLFLSDSDFSNYNYKMRNPGLAKWNEIDDKFEILIEVPGFSKEDIKIENSNSTISIEGKISDDSAISFLGKRSISYLFKRDDIDPETADASLQNGILKITVGKKKRRDIKLIEIK